MKLLHLCLFGLAPLAAIAAPVHAAVQTVSGVSFYPPLGAGTPPVTGPFDATLQVRLSVQLEATSSSGEVTIAGSFGAATNPAITVNVAGQFYLLNIPAAAYFTDSTLAYRVRVRLDGNELGWADVPAQIFQLMTFNPNLMLGVRLRIEARPAPSIIAITPDAVAPGPSFTLAVAGAAMSSDTRVRIGGQDYGTYGSGSVRYTDVPAEIAGAIGDFPVTLFTPNPGGGESAPVILIVAGAASCTDLIRNGTETDVDCGGDTCAPCANGYECVVAADCASGACRAGECGADPTQLFEAPEYFSLDPHELANGIAAGDLSSDGLDDVALAYGGNRPRSNVRVYLQNDAILDVETTYPSYDIPEPVAVADANFDGRNDLFVLHGGWNRAGVYLQNADGTLAPEVLYTVPYASHYSPVGLAVGDIDGDGRVDIAIADYNHGLVVLRNSGGPTFSGFDPYETYDVGSRPETVGIADMNGDGRNDVVMTTTRNSDPENDYSVFVFLQDVDGTLQAAVRYDGGTGDGLALADVDSDGRIDVVTTADNGIGVLYQNASGTLGPMVTFATSSRDPYQVITGDFDSDGRTDVVAIDWGAFNDNVYVLLQDRNGGLLAPAIYDVDHGGYDALATGDLDGDGRTDLLVMSGQGSGPTFAVVLQRP